MVLISQDIGTRNFKFHLRLLRLLLATAQVKPAPRCFLKLFTIHRSIFPEHFSLIIAMIERIIHFSIRNKFIVALFVLAAWLKAFCTAYPRTGTSRPAC